MNNPRHASRHRLAEFGALIADPTRAGILLALLDGSVRPAGELARMSGVAPSTASEHLRRLVEGELLAVVEQGRHRYYRLADPHVAHRLEVLTVGRVPPLVAPRLGGDPDIRRVRTCYDHLAGRLGVCLFEALRASDGLLLDADAVRLSAGGHARLQALGLLPAHGDAAALPGRTCVDWTERRFHLAGPLGARLTRALFDAGWLRRRERTRALAVTTPGRRGLAGIGIPREALGGPA